MIVFVLAAAVGAVLRYLADFYLPNRGILLVNIIGSLLTGLVLGAAAILSWDATIGLLVAGGFTGSLTTFSTVALTAAQEQLHRTGSSTASWIIHVAGSIAAALVGLFLSLAAYLV